MAADGPENGLDTLQALFTAKTRHLFLQHYFGVDIVLVRGCLGASTFFVVVEC
ncbi:hypothetical protein LY76DRAFT_595778 [Colletotrichum caudatum]|nr:hypothetical protein LY76DRAFT_595778 [Colletotrichum caudatum]